MVSEGFSAGPSPVHMLSHAIIGHARVFQAARYQMIMMFLVCSNSGLCCVATVYGAAATVLDDEHRLRLERLTAKQPRDVRMAGALQWMVVWVCSGPYC